MPPRAIWFNDRENMRELVREIVNVLADLSVLSDAKAGGAFDKQRVSQGEGETGLRPPGPAQSDYDRELASLLSWLEGAKKTLSRAKKAPAPVDWRTWVLKEYEGMHYTEAAAQEGVHPTYIRKIRTEARREPITGNRKAA